VSAYRFGAILRLAERGERDAERRLAGALEALRSAETDLARAAQAVEVFESMLGAEGGVEALPASSVAARAAFRGRLLAAAASVREIARFAAERAESAKAAASARRADLAESAVVAGGQRSLREAWLARTRARERRRTERIESEQALDLWAAARCDDED